MAPASARLRSGRWLLGSCSRANRSSSRRAMSPHGQGAHPGGGELDGQRQPVEGPAHLLDQRGRRPRRPRSWRRISRARAQEQRHRVLASRAAPGGGPPRRRRPAAPGWSRRMRRLGHVVEQPDSTSALTSSTTCSQLSSSSTVRAPGSRSRSCARPGDVQRLGDDLLQVGRAVDGLEPDQPDAAGHRHGRATSSSEPGLADTGRSDDVHQPVLARGGRPASAQSRSRPTSADAARRQVAGRRDRVR